MFGRIALVRAGQAGLVWGLIFGPAFVLHTVFGTMPDEPRLNFVQALAEALLGGLLAFAPLALYIALPYARALGWWEDRTRPTPRRFRAAAVLLAALWTAALALWCAYSPSSYGPVSGFTGPGRIGLCLWLAALPAGWAVGDRLPQTRQDGSNPAWDAYRKNSLVLWAAVILGPLIAAVALLFPIFGG